MSVYFCDYDDGCPDDWTSPPAAAVAKRCAAAGLTVAQAARMVRVSEARMKADGGLAFAEWAMLDRICDRAARGAASLPGADDGAPRHLSPAETRARTDALLDAVPGSRERIRAAQDAGWRGNFDATGQPLTERVRLHADARRLRLHLSAIDDRLRSVLPGDGFDMEAAAADGVVEALALSRSRRLAFGPRYTGGAVNDALDDADVAWAMAVRAAEARHG
jgi:hypothetical protein